MGLIDRPQAAQRYNLLSPDVMSLIQSGGPRVAPAPAAPAAPARREPGFLTYLMGGREGLEAERARLQTEAERPRLQAIAAENEGIARSLGPQALLAFRLNGEQLGGQLAEGLGTDVVAQGSGLFQGGHRVGEQPTFVESGDQTLQRDSMGVRPVYTRTAPSIREGIDRSVAETGRINALNVPVGPNTDLVDPTTGRKIYEGYRAPDIQNVAHGGEVLVFDKNGNIINRVGSTQVRPPSDADQTAIARADNQIVSLDTSLNRAAAIQAQIASGELNLGLVENTGAGFLNATGMSNQNSLNYDALLAWAKEARNAILQANTGVQTDQDAIRELDTILSSTRDERIVTAALGRFQEARRATRAALLRDIERRSGGQAQAAPAGGNQPAPSAPGRATHQNAQGQGIYWNGSAWVAGQ